MKPSLHTLGGVPPSVVSSTHTCPAPRAVSLTLERARLLPQRDRVMLELLLLRKNTVGEVGRLLDLHPGTVSRTVHRIVRRLNDPVAAALIDHGQSLPADLRQLGLEHFVQGQNLTRLCALHHMTPYRLRQALDYLRGWARAKGR